MSDGRLKDERRHPGQRDKDLGKGGVTHRPGLPTSFSPLSTDRNSLKRSSGRSTKLDLTGHHTGQGERSSGWRVRRQVVLLSGWPARVREGEAVRMQVSKVEASALVHSASGVGRWRGSWIASWHRSTLHDTTDSSRRPVSNQFAPLAVAVLASIQSPTWPLLSCRRSSSNHPEDLGGHENIQRSSHFDQLLHKAHSREP